jgi:hypothetical protein
MPYLSDLSLAYRERTDQAFLGVYLDVCCIVVIMYEYNIE